MNTHAYLATPEVIELFYNSVLFLLLVYLLFMSCYTLVCIGSSDNFSTKVMKVIWAFHLDLLEYYAIQIGAIICPSTKTAESWLHYIYLFNVAIQKDLIH